MAALVRHNALAATPPAFDTIAANADGRPAVAEMRRRADMLVIAEKLAKPSARNGDE